MKLEGLRVLDLSLFLPGPQLSLMMADQGAEVIKVEPPGEGEPNRHIGPRIGENSVFFRNTHRGKKSVCINLKSPAGREALLKLCETVDVFIEAFRPGVVDRLGIGYEAVAAIAGVVSLNIGNDGEPTMPHVPVADMAASMLALSGVMMALYRREQTGLGDYLDISMHDSVLAWTPNITGPVFAQGRSPVPRHERSLGGSAFYNIYRTSDGRHVVLGAQEIKFVRNLLTEIGRTDLVELCERGPGPHQAPLIELLRQWFSTRTQQEWIEWFSGRDISFAPVKTLREAFDDPQAAARGMRLVDNEGHEHIGVPIRFKNEPGAAQLTLPRMGEHNWEVLQTLGYSAADITQLENEGAIFSH
jgi:crotonobetainyl-CoA:carnitine CoA-transferase CaiB-like acyl-CoA transferase